MNVIEDMDQKLPEAELCFIKWRVGKVVVLRGETTSVRTIALKVPDWPGHVAGQRADVRLTAPAVYSAVRLPVSLARRDRPLRGSGRNGLGPREIPHELTHLRLPRRKCCCG